MHTSTRVEGEGCYERCMTCRHQHEVAVKEQVMVLSEAEEARRGAWEEEGARWSVHARSASAKHEQVYQRAKTLLFSPNTPLEHSNSNGAADTVLFLTNSRLHFFNSSVLDRENREQVLRDGKKRAQTWQVPSTEIVFLITTSPFPFPVIPFHIAPFVFLIQCRSISTPSSTLQNAFFHLCVGSPSPPPPRFCPLHPRIPHGSRRG